MKKIAILSLIAAISIFTSCEEEPVMSISVSEITAPYSGCDASVVITTNYPWEAQSSEWCELNPASGPAGETTVAVSVKPNESYDDRSCDIIFKSNILTSRVVVNQNVESIENAETDLYSLSCDFHEISLKVQTTIKFDVSISADWVSLVEVKSLSTATIVVAISENTSESAREALVIIKDTKGNALEEIKLVQDGVTVIDADQLEQERQALIAIYNALDGHNWTNNENWCSDKPLEEWYGVEVDPMTGYVSMLHLGNNNLQGEIPADVGVLKYVISLELDFNNITGEIPIEMGKLESLSNINMSYTSITGNVFDGIGNLKNLSTVQFIACDNITSISEEIGQLENLTMLRISGSLTKYINCSLPESIGNCTNLKIIEFMWANANKEIPKSIGKLSNLEQLTLVGAGFVGSIPVGIANCHKLKILDLQNNNLKGGLPARIGQMNSLRHLILMKNKLSGDIPQSLLDNKMLWSRCWGMILQDNDFNDCYIPAPEFVVSDYNGNKIDSKELYKSNEYTALIQTNLDSEINVSDLIRLEEIYEKYKDHGLNVVDYVSFNIYRDQEYEMATKYIDEWDIAWPVIVMTEENNFFPPDYHLSGWGSWFPLNDTPSVVLVNKEGEVVMHSSRYYGDVSYNKLDNYLSETLLDVVPEKGYESIDYSRDGEVVLLQKASVEKGIDVILMGDGYSDRLIDGGSYDGAMKLVMESIFQVEPYASYRDYFNVYSVKVVSPNEGFETGKEITALSCYFGTGNIVGGNHEKVLSYARKVVGGDMEEIHVIVAMNSSLYDGTCYYLEGDYGDYGNGISISYVCMNDYGQHLSEVVHHEFCGHGFAKLGDEYAYEYKPSISDEILKEHKSEQINYGWWKNVDFTDDPSAVRWNYFLTDERYANDGLGVFEGGLTYWSGVWRPSENSIMRYNTGGFNAPSREAIYYRIHKLVYGADWEYNYEDFVEYDSVNRKSASEAAAVSATKYVYQPKPQLHAPVVINKSWRDAE